ncbi:hypothetical protein BJX61DRAFT_541272 [Aspergillus egyptiacus]|nr:hypothetical protein BJX61DRAFT_541272 [Aspergillus egyptiacus]
MASPQQRGKMIQAHLIYRILLSLIALATLIIFICIAVRFGPLDDARRYPVPISAAAIAIPSDIIAFYIYWKSPVNMPCTVVLDLIVAILGMIGGFTVILTHPNGGGPDLEPYGYYSIDAAPIVMSFLVG